MKTIQEMRFDPNTTLEDFEQAVREDERRLVSGVMGFNLMRPTKSDIVNAQLEQFIKISKSNKAALLKAVVLSSVLTIAVMTAFLN